jgi:hypothetical protein
VIGLDRKAERQIDRGKGLSLARIGRCDQHAVTARHDGTVGGAREVANDLTLHDTIFFRDAGDRRARYHHPARGEPLAIDLALPVRDDRRGGARHLLARRCLCRGRGGGCGRRLDRRCRRIGRQDFGLRRFGSELRLLRLALGFGRKLRDVDRRRMLRRIKAEHVGRAFEQRGLALDGALVVHVLFLAHATMPRWTNSATSSSA